MKSGVREQVHIHTLKKEITNPEYTLSNLFQRTRLASQVIFLYIPDDTIYNASWDHDQYITAIFMYGQKKREVPILRISNYVYHQ